MIEFNSLEAVSLVDEAATIVEIQAAIGGNFRVAELHFDRDLLSEDYREFVRNRDDVWDDPDYLIREPETCFNLAVQQVSDDAIALLRANAKLLGNHYPFNIEALNRGVLTAKDEPTAVGIAYLWLKLYLLTKSKANIVQFDDAAAKPGDRESAKFEAIFAKVFEYVALFAVSGKYQGESWITAPLRSARDYLELLNTICVFVGHGQARQFHQLAPNEKVTNDGRNDVVHITLEDGQVATDAQLYLVQATIQKNDLKSKVVTIDHVTFFNNFFAQRLNMPKHGVLVVPHAESALVQAECELKNCVYLPVNRILPNLAKVALAGNDDVVATAFARTFYRIYDHFDLQVF